MATQSTLRGQFLFRITGPNGQERTVLVNRTDAYVTFNLVPVCVRNELLPGNTFLQIEDIWPRDGSPPGWVEFNFTQRYNMLPWTMDNDADLHQIIEVRLRVIVRPNPPMPLPLVTDSATPRMYRMQNPPVAQGAPTAPSAAAQTTPRAAAPGAPTAPRAAAQATPRAAAPGAPTAPRAAAQVAPRAAAPRAAAPGAPSTPRAAGHGTAVADPARRAVSGPIRGNPRASLGAPRAIAGTEVRRSTRVATKKAVPFLPEDEAVTEDDEVQEVVKPRNKKRTREEIGYVGVSSDEERQLALKRRRRREDDDDENEPRMTQRLRVV